MPLVYVSGDPLLTRAQALAFGHNAAGRTELGAFETQLLAQSPAAFSAYRKRCQAGRIRAGDFWLWRETRPHLAFMVVRDSSVSATRLRYVQSIIMRLAREYHLEGLKSLAIAPLGSRQEWPEMRPILDYWLKRCALPVAVYEAYLPDVEADEELT